MVYFRAAISFLMMASLCHAAEIVAWKIPLTRFAHRGLQSNGIARLAAAPEASPFFKPGDELWDLKGIPSNQEYNGQRLETAPALEWVIWNAGSGRLVTKGEWAAVWQLHQQLRIDQLPRMCRLTAEVFAVPADGSPFSEKSTLLSSLSWICRFGQKFTASKNDDSGTIQVDGSVVTDDLFRFMDFNIVAVVESPGQERLELTSGVILKTGVPLWLARDFNGSRGVDLRVSGRIVLLDGTPSEEVMLIQKANKAEPLQADISEARRSEIPGKGWLISLWMEPTNLVGFVAEPSSEVDPFADSAPPDILREQAKLEEIEVPDFLKPWFQPKVWNLQKILEGYGVIDKTSDAIAGYDPMTQRVFLFSKKPEDLDQFEPMFSGGCDRSPKNVVILLEGNGSTRLTSRSGQRAHLTRSFEKARITRSLQIEPTIGENEDLVDLRIDFQNGIKPTLSQAIQSSATLQNDTWLELLSGNSADAKTPASLRAKAVVTSPLE